jgi:signal transduction histidine kinase
MADSASTVDATTNLGEGCSLRSALYIARSIVAAHGGTITVDSELGVGATFTVTLPRTTPEPGTELLVSN